MYPVYSSPHHLHLSNRPGRPHQAPVQTIHVRLRRTAASENWFTLRVLSAFYSWQAMQPGEHKPLTGPSGKEREVSNAAPPFRKRCHVLLRAASQRRFRRHTNDPLFQALSRRQLPKPATLYGTVFLLSSPRSLFRFPRLQKSSLRQKIFLQTKNHWFLMEYIFSHSRNLWYN